MWSEEREGIERQEREGIERQEREGRERERQTERERDRERNREREREWRVSKVLDSEQGERWHKEDRERRGSGRHVKAVTSVRPAPHVHPPQTGHGGGRSHSVLRAH